MVAIISGATQDLWNFLGMEYVASISDMAHTDVLWLLQSGSATTNPRSRFLLEIPVPKPAIEMHPRSDGSPSFGGGEQSGSASSIQGLKGALRMSTVTSSIHTSLSSTTELAFEAASNPTVRTPEESAASALTWRSFATANALYR